MSYLTAPRAALVAALLAALAPIVATNALIAFYLTFVALAGMLAATFLAYLDVVDRPTVHSVLDLTVCAVAALLTMFDAAIRFPTVLDGSASGIAGSLSLAALAVALLGTVASLVSGPDTDDLRRHLRSLSAPLSRSG